MNIYDEFSIHAPSDFSSEVPIPYDQINTKITQYNEEIYKNTTSCKKSLDKSSENILLPCKKDDLYFDAIWNECDVYENVETLKEEENTENVVLNFLDESFLTQKTNDVHDIILKGISDSTKENSIIMTDKGNLIDESLFSSHRYDDFKPVFNELNLEDLVISSIRSIEYKKSPINNNMAEQLHQISLCVENCEHEKALRCLKTVIKSLSTSSSKSCLSTVLYYNLGVIYLKSKNCKKALRAFHLSIQQKQTCYDKNHAFARSVAFFQIGVLQLAKYKEYRKSTQAFHEAMSICETHFNKEERHDSLIAKMHNNLGVSYVCRKKYDTAYYNFALALRINRRNAKKLKLNSANEIEASALPDLVIADNLCNIIAVFCDINEEGCNGDNEWKMLNYLEEVKTIRLKYFGRYFGRYQNLIQMRKLEHKLQKLLLKKYTPPSSFTENASEIDLYLYRLSSKGLIELSEPSICPNNGHIDDGIDIIQVFYTINRVSLTLTSLPIHQCSDIEPDKEISIPTSDNTVNRNILSGGIHYDECEEKIRQTLRTASFLFQSGAFCASLNLYNKLVPKVQEIFGEYHPLLGIIGHSIGNVQIRLENYHDAICAFQNAISIYCHLNNDKDNIDTATSYAKIGVVYLLQRNYDMALDIFHHVLNMRIRLLGSSHPHTARIYNNIGSTLLQTNTIRKSREFYLYALDIQRNAATMKIATLASENNDIKNLKLETTMTLINLGNLYRRINQWKNAEQMFREAYILQQEVLGSQNPIVLTTLKMISETLTRRPCLG